MVQLIAVSMKEKTGNEDFKAACRVSQEPRLVFFSFWAVNNETECVSREGLIMWKVSQTSETFIWNSDAEMDLVWKTSKKYLVVFYSTKLYSTLVFVMLF